MHNHTFLGLLAKIKCSICSLEFDNSNGGHCPPCYLTYFLGAFPIAVLALLCWQLGHSIALQPWLSTLSIQSDIC